MGRKIDIQRMVACNASTLPVVSVATALAWMLAPCVADVTLFSLPDYGLWALLPDVLVAGMTGKLFGIALGALSVYCMAEFNNANVLLRVSSRMLSSMLALLMCSCFTPRSSHPGMLMLLLSVLSYFSLSSTYQASRSVPVFCAYLALSVASLFFPKALFLVPVYWVMQSYLRALSLRSFVASLLGLVVPYWILFSLSILTDHPEVWTSLCENIIDLHIGDYAALPLNLVCSLLFVLVLFAIGTVDFFRNSYLDKTRTRTIYKLIIIHGVAMVAFIALQPQSAMVLLPVFAADAAMLFGHFFTLTSNRITHIINLVLLVAAIVLSVWNH